MTSELMIKFVTISLLQNLSGVYNSGLNGWKFEEFLIMKNFCLNLQQRAYPASRKISALRVSFLFIYS
jgi:hypothetical protein